MRLVLVVPAYVRCSELAWWGWVLEVVRKLVSGCCGLPCEWLAAAFVSGRLLDKVRSRCRRSTPRLSPCAPALSTAGPVVCEDHCSLRFLQFGPLFNLYPMPTLGFNFTCGPGWELSLYILGVESFKERRNAICTKAFR